jgi:DHA1 family bicyclomycin/chloramphenicol resistance-like MFS transporter
MYLASWPEIGRLLQASPGEVQLTLSVYLVGFGLAQLIYGPLSDRHGRKPVLLAAVAIYTLASIACMVAPSIEFLIVARFIQAIGGSGILILPRALARDLHDGVYVARELSRIAAVMALTPVIAPLIGAVLQVAFGWRSNFVFLTGFGVVAAILVVLLLPESLRTRVREPVSLASMWASYRSFLRNRAFLAHLGIGTCAFVGLFTWISASSFVMQQLYDQSAVGFGVSFAVGSVGYLIGSSLGAHLVTRIGLDRTLGLGALALATGGLGALAALLLGLASAASIVLPVSIHLVGLGLVYPLAQAGTLLPFPERAGAASSLVGFLQQSAGAMTGAVVGSFLGASAWPLAIGIAAAGCVAVLLWAVSRDVRGR